MAVDEPLADQTTEDILDGAGYGVFQLRLIALCAVGYFAVCAELMLVVFLEEPLMQEFELTKGQYAWLPFGVSSASLIASFAAGPLADSCGRKVIFAGSLMLVGLAGVGSAFAPGFSSMVLVRCLVGIGNACLSVVDYVVFREFTPKAARGMYFYVIFGSGCLGVLFVAALAAFTHLPWRWLVILTALPTLPAGCLRYTMTSETPHFLLAQGRQEEAHRVLTHIYRQNGRELTHGLSMTVASDTSNQIPLLSSVTLLWQSWMQLLSPLALIWFLQSLAYWGLTIFLPEFFKQLGVPSSRTIFVMNACELPGCALAALLVERTGHMNTLRLNLCVASASSLLLAFVTTPAAVVTALASAIYMFLIPNWGVLFLYVMDAFPTNVRGTALGVLQAVQGVPSIWSPFLSAYLSAKTKLYMLAWGMSLFLALLLSVRLRSEVRLSRVI